MSGAKFKDEDGVAHRAFPTAIPGRGICRGSILDQHAPLHLPVHTYNIYMTLPPP
jgi:hypothetical protein